MVHLQVFPELYLPVMTENNLRVLKPWRAYIPSLSQLQHKAKVRQLDSYIKRLLHTRWAERQQSSKNGNQIGNQDVLERIMQALEVCRYYISAMANDVSAAICTLIKCYLHALMHNLVSRDCKAL